MPLLFKPEFVEPILRGSKTQTRRIWRRGPRVKPGGIYQARTKLFGKPFALLKVTRIWKERLGDISDEDARAEGFTDRESFLAAFATINGIGPEWSVLSRGEPWIQVAPPHLLSTKVWAIEFEVFKKCGGDS